MLKAALSAGIIAALAVVMLISRAPQSAEAATLFVFNPSNDGFGTLRWAVGEANYNSGIDRIVVKTTVPITLYETVVYKGKQPLTIQGDHALLYRTIQGTMGMNDVSVNGDDCSLIYVSNGADVTFYQLNFQNGYCNAIDVYAPNGSGEVVTTLNKVLIHDFNGSGVYMWEGGGEDSSFKFVMTNSRIEETGECYEYCSKGGGAYHAVDIDENQNGDVTATITGSAINDNGGDGLHIDESGNGKVTVTATNSQFNDNGEEYICSGDAAQACAAANDDPEAESYTPGDGIHIREQGFGTVTVTLNSPVSASGNLDDGIDVKESAGDAFSTTMPTELSLTGTGVDASNNGNRGIRVSEENSGKVSVKLTNSKAWDNDGDGVQARESGMGDLSVDYTGSSANFNDGNGFDAEESDDGKLTGKFSTVVANANDNHGIDNDEEDAGAYSVTIYTSTAIGNGSDDVEGEAGVETGTQAHGTSTIGSFDLTNINLIP